MSEGLLVLALGAGMLAAVNPCGFALLPAYLSLLVLGAEPSSRLRAVGRALWLSSGMTLGFAAVFAVFGLVLAPAAATVQRHLPWFTVGLGLALVVVGGWLLSGRSVMVPSLGRSRKGSPPGGSFLAMTGFGTTYATASLTCTFAPFLAVVVSAFRTESAPAGFVLFLAYSAGMGLVVGTVAVAVALAETSLVTRIRRVSRWIPRVSGLLLLGVGGYVAYYGWWELRVLDGADPADPVVDSAASLQQALARAVEAVGLVGWAVTLLLLAGAVAVPRLVRR